ncbi:MAG: M23 family metallopeptidase, partial [Bacteroidales bacterium]|nr:M23 family metallopeptidase [Bacteroidales bacterium]
MKRLAGILVALLVSAGALAQEKAIPPLDVPMSFSGTYGELRHDHFHSGLDWRVGGRIGDPVHAIKSGYVARVTVGPWGYGNGLYINHPDGTTSVYGHLNNFREDIAKRVEEAQFAEESFSVDLRFAPEEFPVERGDIVAQVGNTGSSAGPHLHMEIR